MVEHFLTTEMHLNQKNQQPTSILKQTYDIFYLLSTYNYILAPYIGKIHHHIALYSLGIGHVSLHSSHHAFHNIFENHIRKAYLELSIRSTMFHKPIRVDQAS